MFAMLGDWVYYVKWIQLKEIARAIPDREDRISRAYRHWVKFNRNTRIDRMSIVDIVHVWGVYGTELREEIDLMEGDSDSGDDDIM